MLLTTLME